MKHRHFIKQLREDEVLAALREAEGKTSGQIRIFVSHKKTDDAVSAAQKQFDRLGMARTRNRNAVLLFVAPEAHKFAVIGDTAVHEQCGDAFWQVLASELSGHFAKGEFTEGVVHGIRRAGGILATHFPVEADGENELPDEIAHD